MPCGEGVNSPVTGSTQTRSGARTPPFESKSSLQQKGRGQEKQSVGPAEGGGCVCASLSEIMHVGGDRVRIKHLIFLLPSAEAVCEEKPIEHGSLIIPTCLHDFHKSEKTDVP